MSGGFPYTFPLEFYVENGGIWCFIDWDGDGDFDEAYEDVSPYLRDYFVERGKDSNIGRAIVGNAQVTLKDIGGIFIPSSTVSPLTGYVVPGRKVKISRYYKGTEYTLFTGYLDDIQNDYSETVREAYFNCTDGSERFTAAELPASYGVYWNYTSGGVVKYLFEYMGFTTDNYSVDATTYRYSQIWPHRLTVKTALQSLEDAEGSLFYIARAGTARWEGYSCRATDHSTSEWTCPGTVWRSLKTQNNWKNVINRVVMKVVPKYLSPSTAAVLWECPENATTNSAPLLEATCSRSWWADLKDINGNQNGAQSYTTVTGTYFITNPSSLGGGVDRSAHCDM